MKIVPFKYAGMKIVQFKNGKYAVRKGNKVDGYEYASTRARHAHEMWKPLQGDTVEDIACDDLEEARAVLSFLLRQREGKIVLEFDT